VAIGTSGSWNFTQDFDTDGDGLDDGLAEGTWYLHVIAEDSATNRSAAVTRTFDIDQGHPSVNERAIGTMAITNRAVNFSLSGGLGDTNGIASIVATQSKDGGATVAVTLSGTTVGVTAGNFIVGQTYTITSLGSTTNWQAIGAASGAIVGDSFVASGVGSGDGTANGPGWTFTGLPRGDSEGTKGTTTTVDGLYEYVITATDVAGKQATLTRTVRFDDTGPEVTVTNPVTLEKTNLASYPLSGSVNDGLGVGVDYVQYSTDGTSYTNASLAGNTYTATVGLGNQGNKRLYVRAYDKLGTVTNAATVDFVYDMSVPTVTEDIGSSTQVIRNGTFVLTGTEYGA
jgi:hypothetical protein